MKLFRSVFSSFTNIVDGYKDGIFSVLGAGFFMQANSMVSKSTKLAEAIVSWGMAFIVGYGVLRITLNLIWNIFFGRDFKWKINLFELLYKRLKPIKVQNTAEKTDIDEQEAAIRRMKVIVKNRPKGGGVRVGFKKFMKKLNSNKWTILGVGSIVGVGVVGAMGLVDPNIVGGLIPNLGNPTANAITAAAAATVPTAIAVRGVLGKGPETTENYEERIAKKKDNKRNRKERRKNGEHLIDKRVAKLVEFGMTEAEALAVVKKQIAKAKEEQKDAEVKKLADKKAKLAKKLGIDPEDLK